MNDITSIQDVVKAQLCTGCGTCVGLCPKDALKMVIDEKKGIYIPQVDPSLCNNCGICFKVCPGYEVHFEQLNQEIFGKQPDNPLLGNFQNCYVGYATDHDIRYNSSSGGLVTALLIYALENGIIDGALVTRMKKDSPLEPEPFIARTREEIIEAATSKYCPVPANIALKEILRSKEGEKFAVVGLPCHIHGIRKAELLNNKLKNRIVLHFGIFCGGTHNFFATEVLLKRLGIAQNNSIYQISYRGEGFPGKITIHLKNDNVIAVPFVENFDPIFGPRFFRPMRCNFCPDGIGELADISFGDAWTKECKLSEIIGRSIIIGRSVEGMKFIKSAMYDKIITLGNLTMSELNQATEGMLKSKKKHITLCLAYAKVIQGKIVPRYNIHLIPVSFWSTAIGLFPYFNCYCGQNLHLKKIIEYMPLRILKLYHLSIAGYFRYLC